VLMLLRHGGNSLLAEDSREQGMAGNHGKAA
jgi:hypothetical protein